MIQKAFLLPVHNDGTKAFFEVASEFPNTRNRKMPGVMCGSCTVNKYKEIIGIL
jgi:hypothetical protein